MCKKHGFVPIIDARSKILILGTLPSEESLRKNEYFGNPRNDFWKIIFSAFNRAVPESYAEKCKFLLEHGIALWDVLQCAERQGSLDANIKNETPNKLGELLEEYPDIKLIILVGTKAEALYKRYFKHIGKKYVRVSSSSPMKGKNVKSLDEKKAEWSKYLT